MQEDLKKAALDLHKRLRGKIEIQSRVEVNSMGDLSLVYTPGVGVVSSAIAEDPELADVMTWRKNVVAVVSDGTAVLGLGDIGPAAALPVMEGKCVIFKRFAGVNAVPIVLDTKDPDEIVRTVKALAPSFGAIQLEDISAPRCFDIEERLMNELLIPVMHDDQHGTAIVVLAGLLNALKLTQRTLRDIRVVCSGAGAAGTAIAKLLRTVGVMQVILVDRQGALWDGRPGMNEAKRALAAITNPGRKQGSLADILVGADVLIGISGPNTVSKEMVSSMHPDPIVFALANPVPEILPEHARAAGASLIATGRSDFPNQVNNALCYPGLFRGMLDYGVSRITDDIKIRAAQAIAAVVREPSFDRFIPSIFDEGLHDAVAASVLPSS